MQSKGVKKFLKNYYTYRSKVLDLT